MSSSPANIAANQENAKKSTGPVTAEGIAAARGNALKHGLSGAGVVLPVDMRAEVERLERAFRAEFLPANDCERAWVHTLAVAAAQCNRGFELELDQECINRQRDAELWTDDLLLRAATWGELLAQRPDRVGCELRRFSAGCAWLRERWESLRTGLLGMTCAWDDDELKSAQDLLGIPLSERATNPRARDLETNRALARDNSDQTAATAALERLRALVAEQIERLEKHRQLLLEGNERNELDMLVQGRRLDISKPMQYLRRLTAAAYRRYERTLKLLKDARDRRAKNPPPAQPVALPPRAAAAMRALSSPPSEADNDHPSQPDINSKYKPFLYSTELGSGKPRLSEAMTRGLAGYDRPTTTPGVETIDFAIGRPAPG